MRLLESAGWIVIGAFVLLAGCQNRKIDNTMIVEPEGPVSFSQDIQPILTSSCSGSACHIDQRTSGVRLSTYRQVISSAGAQYGEAIVTSGDVASSPIVDKIEPDPRIGVRMPRGRAPLSNQQIALIRTWIDEGAQNN